MIDLETVQRTKIDKNPTYRIDLNKYKNFVEKVTSDESNDWAFTQARLHELNDDVNISLLLTGAIGIASEGGEYAEIVKKCIFQGKPLDDDTKFHIKRELGDIIWYWISTCRSLGLDPNEVIEENVKKLESRDLIPNIPFESLWPLPELPFILPF